MVKGTQAFSIGFSPGEPITYRLTLADLTVFSEAKIDSCRGPSPRIL